jgi:hypothetical protein
MKDGKADMPAEMWVRWLYDIHPGEQSERDVGAFKDAVGRRNRPTELLDDARAYRRLVLSQGIESLSVEQWLDDARPT